ncbi:MAG TPA: SDR family oxidoreductase [Stellaceae bacterium]|nr:SDR family oxidoreductase [Stellaceae bacterium]
MSKVLVITGGSRGIGAKVALGAARQGWRIALVYQTNRPRAEEVLAAVRGQGGEAIALQADIADEAAVTRLFATVDGELGRLSGLVNSAGIIGPSGRLEAVEGASLAALWAINITGTMLCCREAIRRMSTRHGGSGGAIVNLSSAASRLGGAGSTIPYAASKGAIDSLTFGLGQEVAAEGIRVNAVSPGVIDTEIQPPGRVAQIGPLLPMQRVGQPEEVAEAILFLLSDAASYIAGAVLNVSGAR